MDEKIALLEQVQQQANELHEKLNPLIEQINNLPQEERTLITGLIMSFLVEDINLADVVRVGILEKIKLELLKDEW